MNEKRLVGGIELGGTKSLVAVGYNDGSIVERTSLSTVEPELLVPQIADYLRSTQNSLGPIEALGVGAFGPMVVDRNAINYGSLLQTNKPGWSDFDLASALRSAIGLSANIVTDVAAAGIAEAGGCATCRPPWARYLSGSPSRPPCRGPVPSRKPCP